LSLASISHVASCVVHIVRRMQYGGTYEALFTSMLQRSACRQFESLRDSVAFVNSMAITQDGPPVRWAIEVGPRVADAVIAVHRAAGDFAEAPTRATGVGRLQISSANGHDNTGCFWP
jgi:hypothetical protein